ncbi:MAG: hypothetical protein IJJ65_09645 [Butyrivibrio sp.]|nr:hypothetical protein [Butyrivibrio sp.]
MFLDKIAESTHRFLLRISGLAFSFMMIFILINLLFAKNIPYSEFHRRGFLLANSILLILGIVFLLLLLKVMTHVNAQKMRRILTILGFVLSIYVALCTLYRTGWDAGTIISAALSVSAGEDTNLTYFSANPNNRLFTAIIIGIFNMCRNIGINDTTVLYEVVALVQAFLFFAAGLLTRDIIAVITGDEKTSLFGYVIYNLFIGLSPWISIAYTDGAAILFPVLLLWLFLRLPEKNAIQKVLKWVILSGAAVVSYEVKATAIVMFFALLVASFIFAFKGKKPKEIIGNLFVVIFAAALTLIVFKSGSAMAVGTYFFEKATRTEVNSEAEITAFHYLMMGLNDEHDGTFNFEDSEFSDYISDYDERISREKHEIKDRAKDLGIIGVIKLYDRKMLLTYNDGSFGYGLGGEFGSKDFIEEMLIEDAAWNIPVRFFEMPGYAGFKYYITFLQMIWLGLIAFSFCMKKDNVNELSLAVCLMGITVFIMLFEAQQRYLFIFAPIWLIAGVIGMRNFSKK